MFRTTARKQVGMIGLGTTRSASTSSDEGPPKTVVWEDYLKEEERANTNKRDFLREKEGRRKWKTKYYELDVECDKNTSQMFQYEHDLKVMTKERDDLRVALDRKNVIIAERNVRVDTLEHQLEITEALNGQM
jgi:hypothetical protein